MIIVKPNQAGITKAVKILKTGGVIVYPTDTAYALGGIFNSPSVIKKILQIKRRSDPKFTLIAANLDQVKRFFRFTKNQEQLGKKFWPAPLSIVVNKKFAVRVPDYPLARILARRVGQPLIATSVNLSGAKTLYNSQEIISKFTSTSHGQCGLNGIKKSSARGVKPDLIIAAGPLRRVKTSTIIKLTANGFQVIRNGSFKLLAAAEI